MHQTTLSLTKFYMKIWAYIRSMFDKIWESCRLFWWHMVTISNGSYRKFFYTCFSSQSTGDIGSILRVRLSSIQFGFKVAPISWTARTALHGNKSLVDCFIGSSSKNMKQGVPCSVNWPSKFNHRIRMEIIFIVLQWITYFYEEGRKSGF